MMPKMRYLTLIFSLLYAVPHLAQYPEESPKKREFNTIFKTENKIQFAESDFYNERVEYLIGTSKEDKQLIRAEELHYSKEEGDTDNLVTSNIYKYIDVHYTNAKLPKRFEYINASGKYFEYIMQLHYDYNGILQKSEIISDTILTYKYNTDNLPVAIKKESKDSTLIIDIKYDTNNNIIEIASPTDTIKYTYDNQPNLWYDTKYYSNFMDYFGIRSLLFTTYSPTNNITRLEDKNKIVDIEYEYNSEYNFTIALVTITTKETEHKEQFYYTFFNLYRSGGCGTYPK